MESPDNLPASAAETSHSTALDKAISQSTEVHPASASQHTRNAQVNHEVRDAEGTEPRASDSTATDDEKQYPPTWKLLLLTTGLCFALLLVSLDSTILATAIPSITNEFNSLSDVGWYGSSYLFAICALQLLYGKLYTMYSGKWVFLVAVLLFELGSVVSGVSPSSAVLIAGRVISGTGAAGILSGAIILVAASVPLRRRPLYTGILAAVHGIASVIGPLLGGAFTDHLTWRWCFYVNLPFGGATILFLILFMPNQPPTQPGLPLKEQVRQFDLPGTFFLIPCVITLLLALQWGGAKYPWGDGRIIALFVVFGVLAIIFWCVELWQKDLATIPLRLLKNKNITGSVWYGVWLGAVNFLFTYYLPIWFQAIQGVSATQSGIRNIPSVLGIVVFAIISGGLVTAYGQYVPFLIASSAITAVGSGLLSTLKVNSGTGQWLGYQIVMAGGAGLGIQNFLLVAQVAVPVTDMAMATSILSFSQTLSSAIFLAAGQTIFQNQLISNLAAKAPEVNAASVVDIGATALRKSVTSEQLPAVLEAYNDALVQTFYLAVAAGALSIVGPLWMDWISLKAPEMKRNRNNVAHSSVDSPSVEPKVSDGA